MAAILATKLYIPPPRLKMVARPRLVEQLNAGHPSGHAAGLTLISAPAGFGKTTLVAEWINKIKDEGIRMKDEYGKTVHPSAIRLHPFKVAWLSLDEGDNDPARFLAYLVAALQTLTPAIGAGVLRALESPQPPPAEAILTTLLNEIAAVPEAFVLVLDDYHVLDSRPIDLALTFLLEHLPPRMHLIITTREDPHLPLARLRARGQLTELRAADLRFTPAEAAEFLNAVMGLQLSAADMRALETRTEGWIAGLQLAALALRGPLAATGPANASRFVQSFSGSHQFVLDYLVEEVLQRQPAAVQSFLLQTSILDRLCGELCAAVTVAPSASAQATLDHLEHANLFIVPLDGERRWYRYHHLFADLLRQRLRQSLAAAGGQAESRLNELHVRASQWYEDNGLELEAFHHAAAGHDTERAARLIEGQGMPLHFRGAITPVLHWLAAQPRAVLEARPALWVMYASAITMTGQTDGVEEKLQAAEAALQLPANAEPDDKTRNLIGHIAAIRALLAASEYQVDRIIAQSQRALAYLHPANLAVRTATIWKLGIAYQLRGDRAAASQAYAEAIAICQASGNVIINLSATTGLGNIQESDNQLRLAAETYGRVLQLAGDPPPSITSEAYLGLGRIAYEWNDLPAAQAYGQQSAQLAQQAGNADRAVAAGVFLARLKLAQDDVAGAAAQLAEANRSARQHQLAHRLPEVAAVQVLALLRPGRPVAVAEAAELAGAYALPLAQARVRLAQGDPAAALALVGPWCEQARAKDWPDELLRGLVLQAIAHQAQDETDQAVQVLGEALALAEPSGCARVFLDEGAPMARLLAAAAERGLRRGYTRQLLAALAAEAQLAGPQPKGTPSAERPRPPTAQPPGEALSPREMEVLQLVAQGLSNQQISERLFLALDTVKGHNRRIFDKLGVQRRTEAVARARQRGLF